MFHHHHHKKDTDATMVDATATSGANVQRVTRDAALVEEKIINQENINQQEVITRDVEKTEVRQVVQPIHETQQNAPLMHERVLPGKNIEVNNDRGVAPIPVPAATRFEERVQGATTTNAPIIEERVHRKIVEEVQPVVTRDVIQPHEVLVKQPIHEHIVEAPIVTRTTLPTVEMSSGLPATTINSTNYQPSLGTATTTSTSSSTMMNQGEPGVMQHHSAAVRGGEQVIHQTLQGGVPGAQRLVEQHVVGGSTTSGMTGTGLGSGTTNPSNLTTAYEANHAGSGANSGLSSGSNLPSGNSKISHQTGSNAPDPLENTTIKSTKKGTVITPSGQAS